MFDVYPIIDVEIAKAYGSKLWDEKGNEYIDFYGGHAVISIGHSNPRYVKAIQDQISKIGFYSNSVKIPLQKKLADLIAKLSGKDNYNLFLCNSGAEANENALKLASFYNKRKLTVAFKGSFHGRTSLAVAATDNENIVAPINQTDNVVFLPFNDIDALKNMFDQKGDQISSVIFEAIQGVGGVNVATNEFIQQIRKLCDKHNAVMIADEVQCGCGRTGKYFACDHANVNADIYSMAKGIGNGFPIGAIMIENKFKAKYGMLGTTFGGNHLACAAAIAVAQELIEDKLVENAEEKGQYIIEQLKKNTQIKEVRGKGLMIGVELFDDATNLKKIILTKNKIFLGGANSKNIIRLLPALNVDYMLCNLTIDAIEKNI